MVHEMETGVIWGLYVASISQPPTPQYEIFPMWYFILFREHLTLGLGGYYQGQWINHPPYATNIYWG